MTAKNNNGGNKYREAFFVTIVMMLAVLAGGGIAASFSNLHGYGGSAESKMNFLRLVVWMVSLIQIFMAWVVRKAVWNMALPGPKAMRLFTGQIIANAFCAAPAIFGLILTFMTRSLWDYGIFAGLSLAAFAFFFPKEKVWLQQLDG